MNAFCVEDRKFIFDVKYNFDENKFLVQREIKK